MSTSDKYRQHHWTISSQRRNVGVPPSVVLNDEVLKTLARTPSKSEQLDMDVEVKRGVPHFDVTTPEGRDSLRGWVKSGGRGLVHVTAHDQDGQSVKCRYTVVDVNDD